MTISFTSDFPLVIAGTDVPLNPSFEDWDSLTAPSGWTRSVNGVYAPDADNAYPCGVYALKATKNANNKLSQAISLSSFGFTAFPSWATSWVLALSYRVPNSGACAGKMRITYGTSSYVEAAIGLSFAQAFVFLELAGTNNPTGIEIYPATIGGTSGDQCIIDSVMFGLAVDLDVYMEPWNPIPKYKDETRESPLTVSTQLLSDAYDLKCETNHFGPTLKSKILGLRRYLAQGHYYAMILDRASSAPYSDEWMPYLVEQGQGGAVFTPGGPGTFKFTFNGRGNLP